MAINGPFDNLFIISDTAFTIGASDYNRKVLSFTAATAVTVTVPAGLPEGWASELVQAGAGTVTIVAGTGVNINGLGGSLVSPGQYALMFLRSIGQDAYVLGGAGNSGAVGPTGPSG